MLGLVEPACADIMIAFADATFRHQLMRLNVYLTN
jgi:hypothetical protein